MNQSLKKEIEAYVGGWYWDDSSRKYAFELGKFLFSFINYLGDQKLSNRTKRKHEDNTHIIGSFETGYGCDDEFYPENLEDGPHFYTNLKEKLAFPYLQFNLSNLLGGNWIST